LDQPDAHRRAIEDLQERVSSLNEQMEVEKGPRESKHRRHLQVVTVISVFAALVSVGSTGFTLYREHEQEKHRLRGELTSMIQRLTNLKDEGKDNTDEYSILSRLAYDTADKIEEQVSAPEHAIIAGALLAAGDFKKSIEFGEKASKLASNMYDKTWALRQLAWIEFQLDGMKKGSSIYREALETYKIYGYDENSAGVKTDWALTNIEWAQALAIAGMCEQAQEKKTDFERWMSAVVFANDKKKLHNEEEELDRYPDDCQKGSPKSQSVVVPQR
jgi:hypothetical protein